MVINQLLFFLEFFNGSILINYHPNYFMQIQQWHSNHIAHLKKGKFKIAMEFRPRKLFNSNTGGFQYDPRINHGYFLARCSNSACLFFHTRHIPISTIQLLRGSEFNIYFKQVSAADNSQPRHTFYIFNFLDHRFKYVSPFDAKNGITGLQNPEQCLVCC